MKIDIAICSDRRYSNMDIAWGGTHEPIGGLVILSMEINNPGSNPRKKAIESLRMAALACPGIMQSKDMNDALFNAIDQKKADLLAALAANGIVDCQIAFESRGAHSAFITENSLMMHTKDLSEDTSQLEPAIRLAVERFEAECADAFNTPEYPSWRTNPHLVKGVDADGMQTVAEKKTHRSIEVGLAGNEVWINISEPDLKFATSVQYSDYDYTNRKDLPEGIIMQETTIDKNGQRTNDRRFSQDGGPWMAEIPASIKP